MKEYEVWSEGYRISGNYSDARLRGKVEAKSFEEACIKLVGDKLDRDSSGSLEKPLAIWACELYDNEKDARRAFG